MGVVRLRQRKKDIARLYVPGVYRYRFDLTVLQSGIQLRCRSIHIVNYIIQIQVFLFMFIAVGWQLRKERIENEKIEARIRKSKIEETRQRIQRHNDSQDDNDDSDG